MRAAAESGVCGGRRRLSAAAAGHVVAESGRGCGLLRGQAGAWRAGAGRGAGACFLPRASAATADWLVYSGM